MSDGLEFSPFNLFEIRGHPWLGFCVKNFSEIDGHTSSEHFVILTSPDIIAKYNSENDKSEFKPLFNTNVLLRIHSECFLSDVFGASTCDCGYQLQYSLQRIQAEKAGLVIYLRQEGRGIGLFNKMRTLAISDELDTFKRNEAVGYKADLRDYNLVVKILRYLQITSVRLLTGSPQKVGILRKSNISVEQEIFDYTNMKTMLSKTADAELGAKIRKGYRYIK